MTEEEREKLEQEFEELYNKILDGVEWEIEDLDRILEVYLKLKTTV